MSPYVLMQKTKLIINKQIKSHRQFLTICGIFTLYDFVLDNFHLFVVILFINSVTDNSIRLIIINRYGINEKVVFEAI